jgi:hypothetical protein
MFRKTDPETSMLAAESMTDEIRASLHKQVVETLMKSDRPMSAEQIEDVLGRSIWKRMSELERLGRIERSGTRSKNRSGRQADQWVMTTAHGLLEEFPKGVTPVPL